MSAATPASRNWRRRLHDASHSQSFLWKFALGVVFAGVVLGFAINALFPAAPERFQNRMLAAMGGAVENMDLAGEGPDLEDLDASAFGVAGADLAVSLLRAQLETPGVKFDTVLDLLTRFSKTIPAAHDATVHALLAPRFSAAEVNLALDILRAQDPRNTDAYARLKATADAPAPPRHANHALGVIEQRREHFVAASEYFQREGQRPEAAESRRAALQVLLQAKEFSGLDKLRANSAYAEFFTPAVALQIAIGQRDWPGILRTAPLTQLSVYTAAVVVPTVLAALAWTFFLAHLGEWPGVRSKIALICGTAFALGVLSSTGVLYLTIWQDKILSISSGEEPLRILIYNVAAVGLREELVKLLFFAPLLPFLARRDDEYIALIAGCFIGLGFASEETARYSLMTGAAATPGRFLSATFFHVALSGLSGLALFNALRRGSAGINDFTFVFPLTVVAHGLYRGLSKLPDLDNGYLSYVVYLGFAVYFFRRVHELRGDVRMTISLTGSFVFALSVLTAVMVVFQMITLGPAMGFQVMYLEVVGSIILLVMFFREFNESLSR